MNNSRSQSRSKSKSLPKGKPDYYITPTHDFTQYTRDCEEKYWSKDTAFDWGQSIKESLKQNLEQLSREDFHRVAFMVLPMVKDKINDTIYKIKQEQLPLNEDALKDIKGYLPSNLAAIDRAIRIQLPLKELENKTSQLKDQLEITQRELADLRELQRLGLVREGTNVKHLETDSENLQQINEINKLSAKYDQLGSDYKRASDQNSNEWKELQLKIRAELSAVESEVLKDLVQTKELLEKIIRLQKIPEEGEDIPRLKDIILNRQLRGLKDLANHSLVVEQSAIAPLTMGIIHYKRHREIQEAMTTFIRDEAKHSATFRRFLVEKLEAKEFISAILIKGATRYMWLARFLPATGMYLAVIVEIIGAAYLEFFANEKYMPDKLFRSICKTISTQDEKRHIDLCVAMYNELFRKASRWERIRNKITLKRILKSVYGDKDEDHHLIQALRAFGVESAVLYKYITSHLSINLARIGTYEKPEKILTYILGKKSSK